MVDGDCESNGIVAVFGSHGARRKDVGFICIGRKGGSGTASRTVIESASSSTIRR